jgi:hypothetical protein
MHGSELEGIKFPIRSHASPAKDHRLPFQQEDEQGDNG